MRFVPFPVFSISGTLVFFSNYLYEIAGKCTGLKVNTDLGSNPASTTYCCMPLGRPELLGFVVCLYVYFFLCFLVYYKFTNLSASIY